MDLQLIGKNIDEIRKARGFSKAELARRMNCQVTTIFNHIKTGKMTIENLARYAEALGCTIGDLTEGTTDPEAFTIGTDISDRYPWNLAGAVLGITDEDDELYKVYIPALLKSLTELPDREQKILKLRYVNHMTYEQCGGQFGVTRNRIMQIEHKALRRLRHPRHWKHWMMDTMDEALKAKEQYSKLELENEILRSKLARFKQETGIDVEDKTEEPKGIDIPIEDLELSVRSYNCLKRVGVRNISDMEGWTVENFMKVRNLGRKSMMEIIARLREHGMEIEYEKKM